MLTTSSIQQVTKREILIIAAIAFVAVTIFSTSSFLYPFNSWVDANCMFTVGKSVFCGKVPYRDLMDHKGLLLHLIYGIGSLISFRSFFGVYVLELIAGFIFLLYSYKALLLFTDRKILYYVPLLALGVYSAWSFEQGASAEEFCLPFLSMGLSIGLKSEKSGSLTGKDAFLLGFLASCVFWIKYTIVGLFMGLPLYYLFFYVRNKDYAGLLRSVVFFLIGLIPLSLGVVSYFVFNHALADMWTVYFYDNIFHYGTTSEYHGSLPRVVHNELVGVKLILYNPVLVCMFIGSLIALILQKNKRLLCCCAVCFLSAYVPLFVGNPIRYYVLPLVIFAPFSLLMVRSWCSRSKILQAGNNKRFLYPAFLFIALVLGVFIKFDTTRGLLSNGMDNPTFKIRDIIMEGRETPPVMIEYGIMDIGVYTVCGSIPECKNFCHLNLNLSDEMEVQNKYIEKERPLYIISNRILTFNGYKRVSFDADGKPYFVYRLNAL